MAGVPEEPVYEFDVAVSLLVKIASSLRRSLTDLKTQTYVCFTTRIIRLLCGAKI